MPWAFSDSATHWVHACKQNPESPPNPQEPSVKRRLQPTDESSESLVFQMDNSSKFPVCFLDYSSIETPLLTALTLMIYPYIVFFSFPVLLLHFCFLESSPK